MNNYIPKIEYMNQTQDGVITSNSAEITGLDTTDLREDMELVGVGIPEGATILTVDSASQITISELCIADGTISIDFAATVRFRYPPPTKEDSQEEEKVTDKVETSRSGLQQVQVLYTEYMRSPKFDFMNATELASLRLFFNTWASLGKEFRYFQHEDEPEYETYTLAERKFLPKRRFIDVDGEFGYEIELKMRRAVL